jgi:hypothetical protein
MTAIEVQEFSNALDVLRDAYEKYRVIQEQEHAHLNRRGSIVEWNVLVRQKQIALQVVKDLENKSARLRQCWKDLGDQRKHPSHLAVRDKLSQLQALLTRILTCDRMNEALLYNGGYLQSVVAYRSVSMAGAEVDDSKKT